MSYDKKVKQRASLGTGEQRAFVHDGDGELRRGSAWWQLVLFRDCSTTSGRRDVGMHWVLWPDSDVRLLTCRQTSRTGNVPLSFQTSSTICFLQCITLLCFRYSVRFTSQNMS